MFPNGKRGVHIQLLTATYLFAQTKRGTGGRSGRATGTAPRRVVWAPSRSREPARLEASLLAPPSAQGATQRLARAPWGVSSAATVSLSFMGKTRDCPLVETGMWQIFKKNIVSAQRDSVRICFKLLS